MTSKQLTERMEDADHNTNREACQASSKQEDGIAFRFKLPATGLALRSVAVVDGVAELRFDASPKVPTITEEDVATAFRLASESKRPEFFYIAIPPWHPFFGRQFKYYSPTWLRGTSVGELLAEADWNMKCLHVGVQSNETKSKFWSWQKKSNLEGLATSLDFPKDNPPGSVMMSCESAKVRQNENEMFFPEEPKMKIVDDSRPLYTKYITEIYPSIAYHDEPLFLKMQELIKLILATEWFIKKGVNISRKWMMECTTRPNQKTSRAAIEEGGCTFNQSEAKEPPRAMIPPQPLQVKRPTSDVTVKTREAERQQLLAKQGIRWWYGWIDHGGKEMIMFDEDGVQCQRQPSLKLVIKEETDAVGQPSFKVTGWESFPLPPDNLTPESPDTSRVSGVIKQPPTPQNTHQEIISRLGRMSVDVTVDKSSNIKDSTELKMTKTLQLSPPTQAKPLVKQTMTMKAAVDDYDMLYGHMDPNQPIRPEIPGQCDAVVPSVQSWSELFRETVPWPYVLQAPYVGVGQPIAGGGVSTRNIPIKEEPLVKNEVTTSETLWVDQYMERNETLVIQGQRQTIHGKCT